MKNFKQLAIVAALGLAAATAARADVVNNSFVLQNALQGVAGVYDSEFDISDVGNDSFTETPVTHVADDTFVDDYYFNLAESSAVSFDIAAALSPTAGVAFESATLYTATGDFTYSFATMTLTPTTASGSGLALTNGTYALEVIGETLVDGGSYGGELLATPGGLASAVPEPADAAMLVAGLGLMAGLARRRARKG